MALAPLSIVPLAVYCLVALILTVTASGDTESLRAFWDGSLVAPTLVSGLEWTVTNGDALLLVALILLLVATIRSGRTREGNVPRNLLGIVIVCVYVVMFLSLGFAGTSLFFFLTIIALIEALTAVSLSMAGSRPHNSNSAEPASSEPAP